MIRVRAVSMELCQHAVRTGHIWKMKSFCFKYWASFITVALGPHLRVVGLTRSWLCWEAGGCLRTSSARTRPADWPGWWPGPALCRTELTSFLYHCVPVCQCASVPHYMLTVRRSDWYWWSLLAATRTGGVTECVNKQTGPHSHSQSQLPSAPRLSRPAAREVEWLPHCHSHSVLIIISLWWTSIRILNTEKLSVFNSSNLPPARHNRQTFLDISPTIYYLNSPNLSGFGEFHEESVPLFSILSSYLFLTTQQALHCFNQSDLPPSSNQQNTTIYFWQISKISKMSTLNIYFNFNPRRAVEVKL